MRKPKITLVDDEPASKNPMVSTVREILEHGSYREPTLNGEDYTFQRDGHVLRATYWTYKGWRFKVEAESNLPEDEIKLRIKHEVVRQSKREGI